MSTSSLSQNSSRASGAHDNFLKVNNEKRLGEFEKTSFSAFLCHSLAVVEAVSTRKYPTIEEIQKDLEVCLSFIIAAMHDEQNRSGMQTINEALETYCEEGPESIQREAFVKATNAALVLLQPLSMGNSKAAASPDSDDFVFFIAQNRTMDSNSDRGKFNERMPNISCVKRKDILEGYLENGVRQDTNFEQLLEDVTSKSQTDRLPGIEWKHHCSCWESVRTSDSLNMMRTATGYDHDYAAAPLEEYGLTVNSTPLRPNLYCHREDSSVSWSSPEEDATDTQIDPVSRDEHDVGVHPINARWCAEDAEKVFYDSFGRDHIMNVTINDALIRVWYFDHESSIQISAFNFIENLPYFLLFLFALQRFSPADWGYIDELRPVNAKTVEPLKLSEDFQEDDDTSDESTFRRLDDNFQAYHRPCLHGRATHVIHGNLTTGGNDVSVALKLSWREKSRAPEGTFLREATKRLRERDCLDACEYLPILLADKDLPEFSTDTIRKKLMIPVNEESTLLPYFIIIPRYEPLTAITTDWLAFFNVYLALFYCHFVLWFVGIEHRDISDANLMWDPVSKKPKLCDFDLSHFSGDNGPSDFANTGTWRFMAFDLLSEKAMNGEVKRLYRHDLESFVAVLIWIMFRYNNGVLQHGLALAEWDSATFEECAVAREQTYEELSSLPDPEHIPRQLWETVTDAVERCLGIVTKSRALQRRLNTFNNTSKSDEVRERYRLNEDQKRELDDLNSIGAIKDFLSIFPGESPCLGLVQKIDMISARTPAKG